MKTIYVKDLQKNQIISGETFLVVEAKQAEDKNGKTYYDVLLADKTGQIKGKVWSDAVAKINRKVLDVGKLVAVGAKVDDFKGALQLNILDAKEVSEDKMEDYLESSDYNPDDLINELKIRVSEIKYSQLRRLLLNIIDDEVLGPRLKYWPAAKNVHHAFRSGLMQHVLEMYSIADGMEKFYPELNKDLLWAGIFLHDIGKLYELESNGIATEYSKAGVLMGHIVLGVKVFEDFGGKNLHEDVYLSIVHMILSHHGKLEYGSPVLPSTLEAILLSHIDDMSAKARGASYGIKRIPATESFSDYNRWLDGARLWKGPLVDLFNEIEEVMEESKRDDNDDAVELF